MKFDGIENWAAAVFVSPSVTYASHVCYAGRTLLQAPAVAEESGGMWAVVMEVAVREGSYTSHEQTVSKYDELPGEPECPEYRVAVQDACDEQIWRAGKSKDVIVLGCVLINVEFLEACDIPYAELRQLISDPR